MEKTKAWLRFLKKSTRIEWAERYNYIFGDEYRPILDKKVNLFWTGTYRGNVTEHENLGDYLSKVVVEWMLEKRGLSMDSNVEKTKCLYAVGSILGFGFQDATVWGSGLLRKENAYRLVRQKLDIRAVRGPVTRNILLSMGVNCPNCYGDPAILMPLIYNNNKVVKKYKVSVILHHTSTMRQNLEKLNSDGVHYIEILTTDFKSFIDEILSSETIISSALHGIILAESYGIPVVYLKDSMPGQDLKFNDWYAATRRTNYVAATSLEEALMRLPTNGVPDLEVLRKNIETVFPYDLWASSTEQCVNRATQRGE